MNSAVFSLNTLTIIIILIAACVAVFSRKLITSIIALCAVGIVMAFEFIQLHAPDVALAEAAVGAVITTAIFIIALRKTRKKGDDVES